MVEGRLFKLGFKIFFKTLTKGLEPIFYFFSLWLKLKTIYLILKPIVQRHIYTLPLPIRFFIPKDDHHPMMVIMISSNCWFEGFWVFALANQ
jgi:hypothetical protein